MQHEGDWGERPPWLQLLRASAPEQPGVPHHRYPQTPPPPWGPAEPLPLPRPPVGGLLGSRRGQGLLLLSSGCSGLRGSESTAFCLPGRHRLRLEGRHLLGTSFGYSLGSCSLHRGGAHMLEADICAIKPSLRLLPASQCYNAHNTKGGQLTPSPAFREPGRGPGRPTKIEVHDEQP